MKKRYIPLKIAGALLAIAALYVFSYAPVMAFVFWGFNTGHVSPAAMTRADAFYVPIVRARASSGNR